MDLRFVGILFIFGSCLGGCLAAVFLHCLDRFLLGRNLKRVCKSPRKCDPTNPNTMCGYIPPPPSYEHEYLPQSSVPTNTRPSFFNWASCRALLPHSSRHDLPQFSGPTNTPANFLDGGSGRAPSNEHQYSCLSSSFPESAKPLSGRDLCGPPPHSSEHDLPESSDPADILPKSDSCKVRCDRETEILDEILRESKGPLPMGPLPSSPMGPIDKGYVKHFPVADLNRSQLLARQKRILAAGMHTEQLWRLQNWTRATAMNKMGPLPSSPMGPMGPLPLGSMGLPLGPLALGSMSLLPSSPMGPLPLGSMGLPLGSMGPLPLGSLGSLPSSPMGPMGPIDKGYVKHFPVADLHRNQLLALQNWTRATAMNKLPGISAAATSVTGLLM